MRFLKKSNMNNIIEEKQNMMKHTQHIPLYDCWAKLDDNKNPTQNIITHSFLVGYVSKYIIEELVNPFLSDDSKIDLDIIPCIVLHDYGKIHMSFLCKSEIWIKTMIEKYGFSERIKDIHNTTQINDGEYFGTQNRYHHTVVGPNLFFEVVPCRKDTKIFFNNMNLHHGYQREKYSSWNELVEDEQEDFEIDLSETRKEFISMVESEFGSIDNCKKLQISKEVQKLILGITIVADWIASSMDYVRNDISKEKMIDIVKKEVINKNFIPTDSFLNKKMSFEDIFGFKMNSLQKCIDSIPIYKNDKGAIFIIEAETGQGKTEASLFLTYKILEEKLANGLYFALPTQVTSNNIYNRINNFVQKIYPEWGGDKKIKLIHSMSFLSEENEIFYQDSKNKFYSKNKTSLSYPFSIGTIDQMLLSNINVKHADLRYYGLVNKVIIIDELHSYSLYTGTLSKETIRKLRELGCIIIILSATLTKKAKEELIQEEIKDLSYPSILKVNL